MPVRRRVGGGGSGQLSFDFGPPLDVIHLPASRAECRGPGLCPKFSCRYNITLEVTAAGSIRLQEVPDEARSGKPRTVWPVRPSSAAYPNWTPEREAGLVDRLDAWLETVELNCALDIAEAGGETAQSVADRLGISKGQALEYERIAMRRFAADAPPSLVELLQARMEAADERESTDYADG